MRNIFILIVITFLLSGCSGQTKEELYTEGIVLISKGNANGAIVLLKSALEKDPNYVDARHKLANAYVLANKFEQAEKEFQKVRKQIPSRSQIRLEMASLYNTMNKPDHARVEAEGYLKIHGPSGQALGVIGESYARQNKLEQAELYLLQSLKVDPKNTGVKTALAGVFMASKKNTEARRQLNEVIGLEQKNTKAYYLLAALENSLGNRDRALELYQVITSMDKSDPVAPYKMGLVYLDKNQVEQAGKMAAFLSKNFPDRGEGSRLKGIVQYYDKNYTEAIALLQESLKKQSTMEGYYFLGLSLYNRNELENALSQFRRILDYNPSFVQARLLTGVILLKQARVDDAIGEVKKVLAVDERHAFAHNILGTGYMAKGMFDEGMKELNRATELDPGIIDAHLKKGLFNFNSGNILQAETDLKTAVRVAPDVVSTRLVLSNYYMRKNKHSKAFAALKEGLTGQKSDVVFYNGMAQICFVQRKPDEGVKYLEMAKKADPRYLATYMNLAELFTIEGKYGLALTEYRSVLQFDPLNLKALIGSAVLCDMAGREGDAVACYKKAKETRSPAAYLAFAAFYQRKKDLKNALSVVDEGLNFIGGNSSLLEVKGKIYLEEKRYRDALNVFGELEGAVPELAKTLKIYTYLQMNDPAKAVDVARRAIADKPASASGYMMLASIYESQNNQDGALAELKKGLAVDAGNVEALMMLGNIQAQNNNTVAAMVAFKDAALKNPSFAPAYYAQGVLLEMAGKKKEAAAKYRLALTKSDIYVPALNNLACLYADGHGSKAEALRLAMAAYKLQPANPAIMETLGYVLLKNGRKADALSLLEKAADSLPANANAQYHLAVALKENGNGESAKLKLEKALQLGHFPERVDAKNLLAELRKSEKRN